MRIEIFLLILAMMTVTYLPRLLPLYLFKGKVDPFVARFLRFIPYTVLGVMALPGFYESVKGSYINSFLCMSGAALVAYFSENIILSVLASVCIALLLSYL